MSDPQNDFIVATGVLARNKGRSDTRTSFLHGAMDKYTGARIGAEGQGGILLGLLTPFCAPSRHRRQVVRHTVPRKSGGRFLVKTGRAAQCEDPGSQRPGGPDPRIG